MADDVVYDHLSEDGGFKPVHLLSTSYDFGALEKEAKRIETLKTSKGQSDALTRMVTSIATDQERMELIDKPVLPEGTELKTVPDAQGRMVEAAVAKPVDEETVAELPRVHDEDAIPPENRAVLDGVAMTDTAAGDADTGEDTAATDQVADEAAQEAEAAPTKAKSTRSTPSTAA